MENNNPMGYMVDFTNKTPQLNVEVDITIYCS